ncbi:hypothetical protein [Legionella bononiensis]|uniref:hypothetical protein n=1 Tax=Legionella bononiensis TaxID=2793102 RepID=UPI0019331791|nr:hypothetical protein [Legionella bononiensis]
MLTLRQQPSKTISFLAEDGHSLAEGAYQCLTGLMKSWDTAFGAYSQATPAI